MDGRGDMTRGPVAVTGAGGFVGGAIALALAAAGREVVAVDRAFDAPARAALSGLRCVEADLLEEAGAIEALRPAAVIHGAALTGDAGLSPADHLAANTRLLLRALTGARSAGAGAFLFLGSTGVFAAGDAGGADRLTERAAPGGAGPYAAAKRAGEILVAAAAEPAFVTLTVRLGNVFGPGERPRPSRPGLGLPHRLRAEAAAGRLVSGDARAVRDWAWLPDLAGAVPAVLAAMRDLGPGVIHAGSPPVLADAELARLVAGPDAAAALPDSGAPQRPPMASVRRSPFSEVRWTPVAEGLAALGLCGATE